MMKDDGLLYYPLDVMGDEVGLDYNVVAEKNQYKIKWDKDDSWHTYKKETLVNLLIPYYEKYCITGNDKYMKL